MHTNITIAIDEGIVIEEGNHRYGLILEREGIYASIIEK